MRGLKPLRGDKDLAYLAGLRASRMASNNTMNHTVGGNLFNQLNYLDVQWYRYGETIGWSSAAWTVDAARAIYRSWMGSAPHRALLMSGRFNYIGLGLAYRSSNGRTFGSAVMTESLDHTPSIARVMTSGPLRRRHRMDVDGATTRRLQTHTAGLRDFDVQYRVDSGDWRTIRNDTTSTSLLLRDRAHGRYYAIRVRATDRRGNVGAWTAQSRDLGALTGTVRRHPFAAVNFISDPIHGYIELTKRLGPAESAAAGLPAEEVAEEDLLDTAWLQRLRRISQLQSARWVFPTAEHSRFTHGLGVMHEAGLWARSLYPSLRSALAGVARRHAHPVRGPGHRDPAHGGPAARRGPRAVRPFLRRPRPRRLRRARGSPPSGRRSASPTRT